MSGVEYINRELIKLVEQASNLVDHGMVETEYWLEKYEKLKDKIPNYYEQLEES